MRKFITTIFITCIFFILVSIFLNIKGSNGKPESLPKKSLKKPRMEYAGEKIIYDVKLGKVNLGRAEFNYLENSEFNGKEVSLMTFETKVTNFKDLEKIYSDLDSFLPLKVVRNIKSWSGEENIREDYDQVNFTLTINKLKAGKEEKIEIKKDGAIHNAILLPFYLRRMPGLGIGWSFIAELPTQEFKIELVSVENIKLVSGMFETYHFESVPRKFEFWVTTDKRRIPVKIKGAGILGYMLVMRSYKPADVFNQNRVHPVESGIE